MKISYSHLGVLTALILILSCNSNSPKFKSLIGKEYQTLTEFGIMQGYQEQEAILIESLNDIEYGIAHYKKGSFNVVAFERIMRQANGKVNYLLIDVLEINGIGKNQRISCGLCRLNKLNDTDIIAVYQFNNNDNGFSTKVKKAWRANRKTDKFEQIDTKGIDCIIDG
jgi:hypothetical protein